MHSRIIELSKEPVDKESRLTASDIDADSIIYHVADYVDDTEEENRSNDFRYFLKRPGLVVDETNETVTLEDKTVYFTGSYQAMREAAQKLLQFSLDDFSREDKTDLIMTMYNLKSAYDADDEVYVSTPIGLYTMDRFVREYWKTGETYYIGGIVDYHY